MAVASSLALLSYAALRCTQLDWTPRIVDSWAVTVQFRWSCLRTERLGSAAKSRVCCALWHCAYIPRLWRFCMAPALDYHAYATENCHRAQTRLRTSNSYFKSCISSDCYLQKQKDRYSYSEPCCILSKCTTYVNWNGARNPQIYYIILYYSIVYYIML